MDPQSPDSWFALQVQSRHENSVIVHLTGKGYESFLPLEKSRRRWSDRFKEIEQPLFPGYVFCRFDPHARLPILITPGVVGVVGVGKKPIAIEDSEIANIQMIVKSGLPRRPLPYLEIGEKVRIGSGPLEGLEGILLSSKGTQRLVLSIMLLQRSVSVEIDSALAHPVAPRHERHANRMNSMSLTSRALA